MYLGNGRGPGENDPWGFAELQEPIQPWGDALPEAETDPFANAPGLHKIAGIRLGCERLTPIPRLARVSSRPRPMKNLLSRFLSLPPHHRGFLFLVGWTLGLLWLGSIVHVTESSLACPDWPTCFGSMVPVMEGGVFWEHLHRLVAGGLVLLFSAATLMAWKEEGGRSWIWKLGLAGIGILLFQSVLGGLTVIYRLPTAISSSHLTVAFVFLGLLTILAAVTSPGWRGGMRGPTPPAIRRIRVLGFASIVLVYTQSILGGVVRHADAGMACPDAPLCLGEWIPPLENPLIAIHFAHRVVGVILAVVTILFGTALLRSSLEPKFRRAGWGIIVTVVAQVTLGFATVLTIRSLIPTSLHTLGAALLVTLTVLGTTWSFEAERSTQGTRGGAGRRSATATVVP